MGLARGVIASILFAIGWLGLAFHSRPDLGAVATDRAAIHQAITKVDTWSFTPALLMRGEWGWYESPDQLAVYDAHPKEWLTETQGRLKGLDEKIGRRLVAATVLTLLGVGAFWLGVLVFARAKRAAGNMGPKAWGRGLLAGGVLLIAGPLLPCFITEGGAAGLLFTGPPVVTGLVIAAISLVTRRASSPS